MLDERINCQQTFLVAVFKRHFPLTVEIAINETIDQSIHVSPHSHLRWLSAMGPVSVGLITRRALPSMATGSD